MERKVGIVEGYWTPHAARQGAMLTVHLVPREAEEVLGVLGNMTPSKSSLDRRPKALSARWEAQRPQFEARVREDTLEVADTACTVAVSLDGVMAPMKTQGGGYSLGAGDGVPGLRRSWRGHVTRTIEVPTCEINFYMMHDAIRVVPPLSKGSLVQ